MTHYELYKFAFFSLPAKNYRLFPMTPPVISVENLSKMYRLGQIGSGSLNPLLLFSKANHFDSRLF